MRALLFRFRAALMLPAWLLVSSEPRAAAQATQIWFTPIDAVRNVDNKIVRLPQFFQLFTPEAPWPIARAHVQVFKLYTNLIDAGDPSKLRQIFASLRAQHIALAIEYGVLDAAPGQNVEGFFFEPGHAWVLAHRIKNLGGDIAYIAMDEPCWFGADYNGPGATHWSIDRMADNAVRTMRIIQQVFPKVRLGDIEPVQDNSSPTLPAAALIDQYSAFDEAVQKRWGQPLAFFHCDVIWSRPHDVALRGLQAAMAQRHIPFGIIYNSAGLTPDEWFAQAEKNYEQIENNGGRAPDHAVFQSWDSVTTRLLPENEPGTHTHLILTYLRQPMSLFSARSGTTLSGTLRDAAGNPLAGAPVTFELLRRNRANDAETIDLAGVVPFKAVSADFGARINEKGGEISPLDADLDTARYEEPGRPPHQLAFWNTGFSPGSDRAARREKIPGPGGGTWLHLTARRGQSWQLNTARFPVTAGDDFHFTLSYVLHGASRGIAGVGLFFFDAKGIETKRILRPLETSWQTVATATTDAQGRVQFSLPPDTQTFDDCRLEFDGDSIHRAVESPPAQNSP